MKSKVEEFYEDQQKVQGGNLPWRELSLNEQLMFVQAINVFGVTYQQPEAWHYAANAKDFMEAVCSRTK